MAAFEFKSRVGTEENILSVLKGIYGGTWVVQAIKHLTLDLGSRPELMVMISWL